MLFVVDGTHDKTVPNDNEFSWMNAYMLSNISKDMGYFKIVTNAVIIESRILLEIQFTFKIYIISF